MNIMDIVVVTVCLLMVVLGASYDYRTFKKREEKEKENNLALEASYNNPAKDLSQLFTAILEMDKAARPPAPPAHPLPDRRAAIAHTKAIQ